ncbi:hypothetical protein BHE74_00037747, partial [Ensete ventricosum]
LFWTSVNCSTESGVTFEESQKHLRAISLVILPLHKIRVTSAIGAHVTRDGPTVSKPKRLRSPLPNRLHHGELRRLDWNPPITERVMEQSNSRIGRERTAHPTGSLCALTFRRSPEELFRMKKRGKGEGENCIGSAGF